MTEVSNTVFTIASYSRRNTRRVLGTNDNCYQNLYFFYLVDSRQTMKSRPFVRFCAHCQFHAVLSSGDL